MANAVAKYEVELGGRDAVKKYAKEVCFNFLILPLERTNLTNQPQVTELLVRKEMKDGRQIVNPHLLMESQKRRDKVKTFIKPYIEKVIAHNQSEKERKKQQKEEYYRQRRTRKEKQAVHGNSSSPDKDQDNKNDVELEDRGGGDSESPHTQMMEIVQEMSPIGDSVSPTGRTQTPPCLTPGKRRRDEDGGDTERERESEGRQSPKRIRPASPRRDMSPSPPANVNTEVMAGGGGVYVC